MAPVCPSHEEWTAAQAALRPRGRAWRYSGTDDLAGSFMECWFRFQASGLYNANKRLCALLQEIFCSTRVESTAEWMADYGLPDACDPYADICAKVNAVGDTTAAYAEAALLRHGVVATIVEKHILQSQLSMTGCGAGIAGRMIVGARDGVAWFVTVDRVASGIGRSSRFIAGRSLASHDLGCEVSLASVECVLRRIMPAHADLVLL